MVAFIFWTIFALIFDDFEDLFDMLMTIEESESNTTFERQIVVYFVLPSLIPWFLREILVGPELEDLVQLAELHLIRLFFLEKSHQSIIACTIGVNIEYLFISANNIDQLLMAFEDFPISAEETDSLLEDLK